MWIRIILVAMIAMNLYTRNEVREVRMELDQLRCAVQVSECERGVNPISHHEPQ